MESQKKLKPAKLPKRVKTILDLLARDSVRHMIAHLEASDLDNLLLIYIDPKGIVQALSSSNSNDADILYMLTVAKSKILSDILEAQEDTGEKL